MLKKVNIKKIIKTGLISVLSVVLMGGTLTYANENKGVSLRGIRGNKEDIITNKEEKTIEVIKENEDLEKEKEKSLYVGEKGLKLLKEPFEGSGVIQEYIYGDKVQAIRKLPNGWIKIQIEDKTGFTKIDKLTDEYIPKDPQGKEYKPNTIYLMGKEVPYKNTGPNQCQSQIDNHPETAATFGGTATFSGDDNMNTHFAAHNYGAFNNIWNMPIGSEIIVTDGNKKPFKYTLNNIKKVTYDGYGYADGKDYWNEITGTGGGERIVLQTCIFGDDNGVWILTANASDK